MSKKKSGRLTAHDACVREIADELKKDNWAVKASLEGWEKPSKIGESIPDIEAEKGCLKRICEVATEEMFEGDKERYREFKNYCDEYDFQFYVVDKKGRRRRIDPKLFGKK
jgi:hypothetical protein